MTYIPIPADLPRPVQEAIARYRGHTDWHPLFFLVPFGARGTQVSRYVTCTKAGRVKVKPWNKKTGRWGSTRTVDANTVIGLATPDELKQYKVPIAPQEQVL